MCACVHLLGRSQAKGTLGSEMVLHVKVDHGCRRGCGVMYLTHSTPREVVVLDRNGRQGLQRKEFKKLESSRSSCN